MKASMLHEVIVSLFQNRPSLAAEMLRDGLGAPVPKFTECLVEAASLAELFPAEVAADLVVVLRARKRPLLAIVLEAQLWRSAKKRMSWPMYVVGLRARLRCPTYLLVVTTNAAIARYCAKPIEIGHPGFTLRPLVLGPDAVPVVTDAKIARQVPEVAVLSALAHGKGEHGEAIGRALLKVAPDLDEDRRIVYVDYALGHLNEAARAALEEMMKSGYQFQSAFAREYYGKGRVEGRAGAILSVLEARKIDVPEPIRERILACSNVNELDRIVKRAAVVTDASELFKPARSRSAAKASPPQKTRS